MFEFFFETYRDQSWISIVLEIIVFFFGIISVWYAGKENILVYPTGLIATIITVYLLYVAGYLGEVLLNAYYSLMSLYGWYNWNKLDGNKQHLQISRTNLKEKLIGILICLLTMGIISA